MSMINIALSGLNANKVALDVTAQNVANVNTPGYSRQQVLTSSLGGQGRHSAGGGVEVTSIRRVADQFLVKQTWQTNSQAAYSSRYLSNMSQLESLLGADAFSLSGGLDTLYAALNDATVKPQSIPLRQQVINEAEALSRRFNTLTESLHAQHKNMSDQRGAAVEHANSLLSNLADVNRQIVEASATSGNAAQLLDTRENLIGELSKLMDVRTTEQPDGSLQVTLASGQPLVLGSEAAQLNTVPDNTDPYLATLNLEFSGQHFPVNGKVGGQLGAIDDYQLETLKPNLAALNDMAANLADEFNRVLATGKDLNGNQGAPLFTYNPANPAASLTVADLSPEDLAFSADGTPGNSEVLQKLVAIGNQSFAISGFGNVTINDAFTSMVGETAIKTRQASADHKAAESLNKQALAARDNLSAVNSDEEAANLMVFANAYQANMKVISTANQMFDTVLQLF
ncbi:MULTISPECIES: flagellar hook-associated protein FlgK [Photobacterium]|uniref:Flagellar hook-associated protein 1 n=1 Tax=Photobacterium ganghwense TaxID=320778 RepID=A0A0J1HEF4_9GAMM|nr:MULTISPECIES: flagellar hook-associated protein FlgK [Photobacterium]KLV09991.1 flagellar hook protein FlgK [Photobacterium ganghwense]MBV1841755.1 flagellar hook-associated protein FlgK [Photobacterium ganghwense]PSU09156.1 flagellar hook-associated protein FlgK [Photobacterium ganghwense]QSV16351.1 flagellar hook-associated protein FlgK [Photobacterium ganghwense]